jgi:hypothetical protein
MVVGILALVSAAIFAGVAFYVSAAEHPARLRTADGAALQQWKPSYKRGAAIQAPLAIAGFLLGAMAFWQSGDWRWLAGALAMIANWPYTLIVIKPVNDRLLGIDPAQAGTESRALLERWGHLHAGRTALGAVATIAFLWALL